MQLFVFDLSRGLVQVCKIDLSHMGKNNGIPDLVPFHSEQIRNFYFNTCPGTILNKFKTQYFIFGNSYELTCCVENSVGPDQLASFDLDLHCFH